MKRDSIIVNKDAILNCEQLREGDFLKTSDNLYFEVRGNIHPPKYIIAFLRYAQETIYKKAAAYARKKGIIIADTKFEFGKINNQIIIVDELLTPDSSRFWPTDAYNPGESQKSYDKQFVRDYLSSTGWDKNSTPPHLPNNVIEGTKQRYMEAYEKLTGKKLLIA